MPEASRVAPAVGLVLAAGLEAVYGDGWREAYGTAVGRTLTGASPAEALPAAGAGRERLVAAFEARMPGTESALRGALADALPLADRAVVNRAALEVAVARDPEALLPEDLDIPRGHLDAWRALASTAVPQGVLDRMDAMNEPIMDRFQQRLRQGRPDLVPAPTLWEPLTLENAAGGIVNMDYFAVRVRMPEGADPGVFLNQIRTNLNRFVDTSNSTFAPYPDVAGNRGNVARWNSDSPTGSFVSIDIPANDGTVAVIDSGPDRWTFATVQSPQDGLHPVSGNRTFGYTDNRDGTVTFYTRGVDRITDYGTRAINWATNVAFAGADALWSSFQQRVAAYVRETGGQAQVEAPVIVRPDWSRVDAVLTGRESVQTFLDRQARDR